MLKAILGAALASLIVGSAVAAPATAIPLNLSYCSDKQHTIAVVREQYPNLTYVDYSTMLIFEAEGQAGTLLVYFDALGCAEAYQIISKSSA